MNLLKDAAGHGQFDTVEWMLEVGEDLEGIIGEDLEGIIGEAIEAAEENNDSDTEDLLRRYAHEKIGHFLDSSEEDIGGAPMCWDEDFDDTYMGWGKDVPYVDMGYSDDDMDWSDRSY